MKTKEDKGLIGFDPLAWMSEESSGDETDTKTESAKVEETVENNLPVESSENETVAKNLVGNEVENVALITSASDTDTHIEDSNDDSKIILNATLNIQNVTELYERLLKCLESQDLIEIDASAVVVIDTATLQLLIVLKQTAIKLHKEVVFDFPSEKFIVAAELLGLSEMLDVNQAAAGLF